MKVRLVGWGSPPLWVACAALGLILVAAVGCGDRLPADVTRSVEYEPAEIPGPGGIPQAPAPTTTPLRQVRLSETFTGIQGRAFNDRTVYLTEVPGPGERLAVVNQAGTIVTFRNNPAVEEFDVLLDISDSVSRDGNEEGLLGLAFDPDFAVNGRFYVYYSAADPRRSVLSRFVVGDAGRADMSSELVLLEIEEPFSNHNGGMITFGPDRMLYVGVGDGGSRGDPHGNGQNPQTLLGTVLRIIPPGRGESYTSPAINPFNRSEEGRPEVWAYGLRNPWRFSFDRETGDLWLGDVGQGDREEINLIVRGGNYGWNRLEGSLCFSPRRGCDTEGVIGPVVEYDHTLGCSVTGGYVYRGESIEWLQGAYVYGDFCSGRIWAVRVREGVVLERAQIAHVDVQIASFGEDAEGELYITGFKGGVYRVVDAAE